MNDEDAWQAYLDANPEDHFARQAFADWLDDRCDPRAAGMRVMGRLEKCPWYFTGSEDWGWFYEYEQPFETVPMCSRLPRAWEKLVGLTIGSSRAAAEDAAAMAWTRLTPEQQAEILSRVEVTA